MFAEALLSRTGRSDFEGVLTAQTPGRPPSHPNANAIKRVEASDFPRVAEDAAALIGRAQECFHGLIPGNFWHGWVLDQVASTTFRLDRCGRIDRRLRDSAALRAGVDWDEDRDRRAEAAGSRLAERPVEVVAELRASPHGCDWLIRRWAALGLAAESAGGWTEDQGRMVRDRFGLPAEAELPPDPAEIARREIAALRARKAEVLALGAVDRAMAESDLTIEPTLELKSLARHEARLRGWLRWLVAQIRTEAPKHVAPLGSYPRLPESEAEADRTPATAEPRTPDQLAASAEVEAEAGPRHSPDQVLAMPRIPETGRKDPKALRDSARSEARRRKRDLRRA